MSMHPKKEGAKIYKEDSENEKMFSFFEQVQADKNRTKNRPEQKKKKKNTRMGERNWPLLPTWLVMAFCV